MTIRMLQAWNGLPEQTITTLSGAEESRLVGLGLATFDLDGPAEKSQYISVKDFGAVGDGVTDDTAAIQKAIDECYNTGGGVVYIPRSAGTYRVNLTYQTPVSGAFHVSALWLKDGVTIDATGAVIEAFKNNDTHGTFVSFSGRENAHVIGGKWLGDKAKHAGLPAGEWCFAFVLAASKKCSITRALIQDSRGDGIYVGHTAGGVFDPNSISYDIDISGNAIINCGRNGISVVGAQRYTIVGNIITGTYGYSPQAGIDIEPDYTYVGNWGSVDGIVADNVVTENHGDGITVFRSSGLSVTGNTISRNGERGISLRGDVYSAVISGNHVKYAGLHAAADSDSWYGLYADELAGTYLDVLVSGNDIDAARCFYVASSGDVDVSNNKFTIDGNAAALWGVNGSGTANPNSYFTSTISSASSTSVRFRNNAYRVLTTATFRGEVTFLMSCVRGGYYNNTFYNINAAGGIDIRLDGSGTTPYEFHNNSCNDNLRVGQLTTGWWSAANVDFSRSLLNGDKPTYIFVKTNSPTIGWVMPGIVGNTYDFAYGIDPGTGTRYKFKVYDGSPYKYAGAYA